jgi:hypothetical protein
VGRIVKALSSALLAGVLFGVGLCVSGMTDPKNIQAFLDVTGHWSANSAGVMLGAIAVHAVWLRFAARATATGGASLLAPQLVWLLPGASDRRSRPRRARDNRVRGGDAGWHRH